MIMLKKVITRVSKYFTKQASKSELDELSNLLDNSSFKEEFTNYIKINLAIDYSMKKFDTDKSKQKLLHLIEKEKKAQKVRKIITIGKYAAVFILLFGVSLFVKYSYFTDHSDLQNSNLPLTQNQKILPGSDNAILTLEDGSVIDLRNEVIENEKIKNNTKKLTYNTKTPNKKEVSYNFLTIPRGGQYQLQLSDGTVIWLNSETQLKYPVTFTKGKTRIVELIYGEIYLDVSPDSQNGGSSFKVINKSQEIEVLGTEFNIKAYKNEMDVSTTLVEGKILLSAGEEKQILLPNQKAKLNLDSDHLDISTVDVTDEISWKRGVFSFRGTTLEEIAKVLSRWYNVEISFTNPAIKDVTFNGMINKKESIENILNIIISTNSINAYEIKNNQIFIK